MKKSKFAESQIVPILAQQEQGMRVADICREYESASPLFTIGKRTITGYMPLLKKISQTLKASELCEL